MQYSLHTRTHDATYNKPICGSNDVAHRHADKPANTVTHGEPDVQPYCKTNAKPDGGTHTEPDTSTDDGTDHSVQRSRGRARVHATRCSELLYPVWTLLPWLLSQLLHQCAYRGTNGKADAVTDARAYRDTNIPDSSAFVGPYIVANRRSY